MKKLLLILMVVMICMTGRTAKFAEWVDERVCFGTEGAAEAYHAQKMTETKKKYLVNEEECQVRLETEGCSECYAFCSHIKVFK